ncbi:DMT family transporter [Intestinibacter sp.]
MKDKIYLLSKIALFATAIIWGSTFVIVKGATDTMPSNLIMAIRFSIGSIVLGIIFRKKFKLINKEYIIAGIVMGLSLWISFLLQVEGLSLDTEPGKSAFLTALYCVIVPFFYWIVFKDKPDKFNFLAAFICIIGIGLVSLNKGFGVSIGDILTLISGIFAAINIVSISYYCKDKDEYILTFLQITVVAIISWILTIIKGEFLVTYSREAILGVTYLGIFATAICFVFQSIGLKYTSTSSGSIILSLESVFGIIFSILIYHEVINIRLGIGFLLIFIAVIISETKLKFLFD